MLEADELDDPTAYDAASELADHPKAEAAGEQPGNSVPLEPSMGQPMDPHAVQGATEADAMEGTPRAGACDSGQLFSTPPPADGDHHGVAMSISAGLAIIVRSHMAREADSHLKIITLLM